MQLFRDDQSATTITIILEQAEDGGLRLAGHDIGEAPRQCFGSDDYEYAASVPAEAVAALAMELIADQFGNDAQAVSKFRDYCAARGVPCIFSTYP